MLLNHQVNWPQSILAKCADSSVPRCAKWAHNCLSTHRLIDGSVTNSVNSQDSDLVHWNFSETWILCKKWAFPAPFYLYFRLFNTDDSKQINVRYKSLPMTVFELRTSGVKSHWSINWAAIITLKTRIFWYLLLRAHDTVTTLCLVKFMMLLSFNSCHF